MLNRFICRSAFCGLLFRACGLALIASLTGVAAATHHDLVPLTGTPDLGLANSTSPLANSKATVPSASALVLDSPFPGQLHNIQDSQRRFSSIYARDAPGTGHARSQIDSAQAWSARRNDTAQWLELPVGLDQQVIGVATQGRHDRAQWVTEYRALARLNDGRLLPLNGHEPLTGNNDQNSIVWHLLAPPAGTVAIRLQPTAWQNHISMRAGLLVGSAQCTVGLSSDSTEVVGNLVRNGSFEQHPNVSNGAWQIFDSIDGWTTTAGIEVQLGQVGNQRAIDGDAKIELDTNRNTVITQTLSTESGGRYILSFDWSPRVARRGTNTNNLIVRWNGEVQARLSGDFPNWQSIQIPVTASAAVSELRFEGSGRSDSYGALLDNVAVREDRNLLVNGSFEHHGTLNRGRWGTFDALPGWQTAGTPVEIQRNNVGGIQAFDGLKKLELDAHINSSLSQSITADVAREYELYLAYSPRVQQSGSGTNDVAVRWNGEQVAYLAGEQRGWTWHNITLEGSAGTNTVDLAAMGVSDSYGGLIDQVILLDTGCDNPEPDPLNVSIVAPGAEAWINTNQADVVLDVSGTAMPDAAVELSLDGIPLTVNCVADSVVSGRLYCPLPQPLSEGEHRVSARVTAPSGAAGDSAVIRFQVDTISPVVRWDRPDDGTVLSEQPVVVRGAVSPASDTLSLNGEVISLNGAGEFDTTLSLEEGEHRLVLRAQDLAGNSHVQERVISVDRTAPLALASDHVAVSDASDGESVDVVAPDGSVEAHAWIEITNTRTGETVQVRADENGAFRANIAAQLGDRLEVTVVDLADNRSAPLSIDVRGNLPPDPATVAPVLPTAAITPPWDQWAFLHESSDPVQRGMLPDTITPEHVALLRGKVLDVNGEPLPGVQITIKDHPEYGHTLSRLDGLWDMVINGGGASIVEYRLDGYLPIQRQLDPAWLQTEVADDVVMTALDTQVTTIDTSDTASAYHRATGAHVTDRFGERKLHMLFPAGAQAHFRTADGTQVDLDQFNVRATEYTVGDLGPNAMPGELPPASMYTYAMELTLDEAADAVMTDGRTVWFDAPIKVYLDNFLNAPTGVTVPLGYYNRESSLWESENDGRVVEVLEVDTNGLAVLSLNDDGTAATKAELDAHQITDDERREIAGLYDAGESFWRIQVTHFTPYDCNYWAGRDLPSPPAGQSQETETDDECAGNTYCGSLIQALQQTVSENIPIAGTNYNLVYKSDRSQASLSAHREIPVTVTDDNPPDTNFAARLKVTVGGQMIEKNWPLLNADSKNIEHTVVWDGNDAYGRPLTGSQRAVVELSYLYVPTPLLGGASTNGGSFGAAGNGGGIRSVTMRDGLPTLFMTQQWDVSLSGSYDLLLESVGLGGWTVTGHSAYESSANKLARGDGSQLQGDIVTAGAVEHIHTSDELLLRNGFEVSREIMQSIRHMGIAPDGTLYISDLYELWQVDPDGLAKRLSAPGQYPNNSSVGNGGLLSEARFKVINDLKVGADGRLYIVDDGELRIATPGGMIDKVPLPDDFPATYPIAVGSMGEILFCKARYYNGALGVYRTDSFGTVSAAVQESDDQPNIQLGRLQLQSNTHCDYSSAENALYYTNSSGAVERTLGKLILDTGENSTIFGTGNSSLPGVIPGAEAAGIRNTSAFDSIASDPLGGVYFTIKFGRRIYYISPEGKIRFAAGNVTGGTVGANTGDTQSGARAIEAHIGRVFAMAAGPDGRLWAHQDNYAISRIVPSFPLPAPTDFQIYDTRDRMLLQFDRSGRQNAAVDPSTRTVLRTFTYNSDGHLDSIVDRDGDALRIERISGSSIQLISPDGQTTSLEIDNDGNLGRVVDPANRSWSVGYHRGGLIQRFEMPSGNASTFSFDTDARLFTETDPAGGGWTLDRNENTDGHSVDITSGEGRTDTLSVRFGDRGEREYHTRKATGAETVRQFDQLGGDTTTTAAGSVIVNNRRSGPEYGGSERLVDRSRTFPSGLVQTQRETRTLVEDDITGERQWVNATYAVNGRNYRRQHNLVTRKVTDYTPLNRVTIQTLDTLDRPIAIEPAGLANSTLSWRADGRLESTTTTGDDDGSRTTTYGYFETGSQQGYLQSVTDALGRSVNFERDAIGRVSRQTLPDGRSIGFSYDANGNLESLTPPGRSAHVFRYNTRDLPEQDEPPVLPEGLTLTQYEYNLDKQLDLLTRPGNQAIDYQYNATTGQLDAIVAPRGTFGLTYDPATAQLNTATTPEGNTVTYAYDGELPTGQACTSPSDIKSMPKCIPPQTY